MNFSEKEQKIICGALRDEISRQYTLATSAKTGEVVNHKAWKRYIDTVFILRKLDGH